MFLAFLLRNNISNKLFMLGFVIAIISYSAWHQIEDSLNIKEINKGCVFYIGISFAFICYASAYMFSKWNKWRWFPLYVTLICISRLIKEFYYLIYPEEITDHDIFDYINMLITIYIVFSYYIKHRHKQYIEEND